MNDYTIDWENVNLKSDYQKSLNILEPYNFEILLLELYTNIPNHKMTKEEITKHFNLVLNAKVNEAKEIFEANLQNILKQAIADKEDI